MPSFQHLQELRYKSRERMCGKNGQSQGDIFEHGSSSFDAFSVSRHSSSSSQDSTSGPRWADMSDSEDDGTVGDAKNVVVPVVPPHTHQKITTETQVQSKGRNRLKTVADVQPDMAEASAAHGRVRNNRHKGNARNKQHTRGHDTKHQCQFFIGIEEEPKFRVVRRIIGTAGANVKNIAEQAGPDTKLRLRGRGSKFFEGPEQQEAQEPLMLCVSVPNRTAYDTVVRLVREQLERVYEDYDAFRLSNGQNAARLRVRMHEGPRAGSR
jgi:hypothetical protein